MYATENITIWWFFTDVPVENCLKHVACKI